MECPPFSKLPRELRDEIYSLVLHVNDHIDIRAKNCKPWLGKDAQHLYGPLSLTETCKQIRHESLPIFYTVNHFNIIISKLTDIGFPRGRSVAIGLFQDDLDAFKAWISQIGRAVSGSLRYVNIDLGQFFLVAPNAEYWSRSWTVQQLVDLIHSVNNDKIAWSISFTTPYSSITTDEPLATHILDLHFSFIKLQSPKADIERAPAKERKRIAIDEETGRINAFVVMHLQAALPKYYGRVRAFVSGITLKLSELEGQVQSLTSGE